MKMLALAKISGFLVLMSSAALTLANAEFDTALEMVSQGDAEAQYSLGKMYYEGEGVLEDAEEAVKWYQEAAKQGHPEAQISLGIMYFQGEGIPQDKVRAYSWLNIAAVTEEKAGEARELIEAAMTPQQIAQAQRLSSEYFENNQ